MQVLNKVEINRSLSTKIVDARVAHAFNAHKNVLITSSFGTTSAIMLHIVSRIRPNHPIYFINTRYHFEETLQYKELLTRRLGLNVIDLEPEDWKHDFTVKDKTWSKDPNFCCQLNKVEPLDRVKKGHDVWISGLIGYQNNYRSHFEIMVEKAGMYKFYPLIDWSREQVDEYFELHGLPRHPLEALGYDSIGCTHCTQKGKGRAGRWPGSSKNECGLHL